MLENHKQNYLKRSGYSSMSIKAMLFDMDGVLFDSMPNHATSWIESTKAFGLSMDRNEAYMNEGRTGASTINEIALRTWNREATELEIKQIYAKKTEIFNQCPLAQPMSGAWQVLQKAKQAGLKIVLVTGSGQKTLLDRLNRNFPGIFTPDNMVTAYDVKYGKPNPEPYLIALQKAGVQANEAIVVENAPLGVRAGVAANIFTLAVNTGPLPDSVLIGEGADALFPSMLYLSDNFDVLMLDLDK